MRVCRQVVGVVGEPAALELEVGSPHMTYGVMVMTTPGPSGPVTMATVCHFVVSIGNEDRSVTLRSASVPDAVTCAPPLRRTVPAGHEVLATRTLPTAGLGADLTVVLETIEVAATVPAGPAGPAVPLTPCGPRAPVAPTGP